VQPVLIFKKHGGEAVMKKYVSVVFFVLVFCFGCEKSSHISSKKDLGNASQFTPFIVYQDKGARENHFIPSGFMPNGKCLEFNDVWQEGCYDGATCIKIVYDVECSRQDQQWGGIFWLNPANNWGAKKGGFNLTGAQRLTFWARGEKGGERIEEFGMGGVSGNYPDSDAAMIGPVILTSEWQQYAIDLRGKDLSYISGGFSWTTNVKVNGDSCIFYLDRIQYE
jgi:hypothetical protein